ncbi:hypothetical protein ACGLWX_16205, partial [Halomonas sp. HMF6819]|uniref:hypothetical protein n=1 Tax=Halomonas sp. HMF6819 TaxID=3373085 RepID=UPI0037901C38
MGVKAHGRGFRKGVFFSFNALNGKAQIPTPAKTLFYKTKPYASGFSYTHKKSPEHRVLGAFSN